MCVCVCVCVCVSVPNLHSDVERAIWCVNEHTLTTAKQRQVLLGQENIEQRRREGEREGEKRNMSSWNCEMIHYL